MLRDKQLAPLSCYSLQECLEREYNLDFVTTAQIVVHKCHDSN
jgi:translation elongation factor EF-4